MVGEAPSHCGAALLPPPLACPPSRRFLRKLFAPSRRGQAGRDAAWVCRAPIMEPAHHAAWGLWPPSSPGSSSPSPRPRPPPKSGGGIDSQREHVQHSGAELQTRGPGLGPPETEAAAFQAWQQCRPSPVGATPGVPATERPPASPPPRRSPPLVGAKPPPPKTSLKLPCRAGPQSGCPSPSGALPAPPPLFPVAPAPPPPGLHPSQ